MIDQITRSEKVQSLQADVGDASASTLGSIYAILGNPGTTFTAQLAAIAGYIDTEVAAILAAVDTEVAAILAAVGDRATSCMDFWSDPQEEIAIANVAADKALPDIVVALPAGATVVKAVLMFKFRAIENTNAAVNKLNGAQEIQIRDDTPSAWVDAINFVDDMFGLAASTREGGDVVIGDVDVKATVDGDDTYNVQWDEASADQNNLQMNDVQVGLRIWFR